MANTPLIIQEHPVCILPSLAVLIGLNEAIVVQQLHFMLLGKHSGVELNGHKWIWNTYDQWKEEVFPFWSVDTIKRTFSALEEMHIVESCQPDGYASRKKYYRLNRGMVQKLIFENLPPSGQNAPLGVPSGQNASIEEGKMHRSLTETTTDKKKASPSLSERGRSFADWFRTTLPEGVKLSGGWRDAWAKCYDDMIRLDSRKPEDIAKVCKWARADSFWSSNFMSPTKLRDKKNGVMYFDLLLAKTNEKHNGHSTNGTSKDAGAGTANEGKSSQYAGVGRIQ